MLSNVQCSTLFQSQSFEVEDGADAQSDIGILHFTNLLDDGFLSPSETVKLNVMG